MTECQKSPSRVRNPEPADSGLSPEATQQVLHDLRVHQLELELQNEELRRVHHELETSRARYFDLYDLAPIGYLTLTESGVIQEANLKAAELLGEARSELVGQPLTRFILPADQDIYYAHRQQLADTTVDRFCELRLGRNRDVPRWVALNTIVTAASDGARVCRAIIQDIHDRKRTETTLKESELRHRVLFEQSPDPLLTLEPPDWNISAVNAATVALFGVRGRETLISHALLDNSPEFQSDGKSSSVQSQTMTDVALRDGCHSYSWTYCRPSGEEFPATVLLTRLEVGGMPLLQARIRDETGAKAAQVRLAQADRLASMGMLAASVAHEINNPLAYVLYNIESLTEDLPKVEAAVAQVHSVLQNRVGAEVTEAAFGNAAAILTPSALHDLTERAEEALGGTERIRSISQAIGTFSRVERSQSSSVDLNYAVECAITMAHTDIKLLAQLTIDLGEIPPVQATIGKLSQVFLNLLINATHAFDASKVEHNRLTVRTWCEGNDVLAEVRDTGQGMSKEQLSRIFEPFYTTKGVGMGSGLGLSICRNILTEFGGDIRAESEPGRGSRFIIRLPADLGEEKQPAETAVAEPARATLRGRLLVVDDEPAIRTLMVRLLGQQHDIVTAESGKEAQLLLEHDSAFDVILCDLMMPGMTGMDLHEWLVAENAKLAGRMVFITGGAFTPKATDYLASADILTLEKPYEPVMLRQVVTERVLAARFEDLGAGSERGCAKLSGPNDSSARQSHGNDGTTGKG